MKRFTTLTILCFVLLSGVKAQVWADRFPTENFFGHKKLGLDAIQGSPYLTPDYIMGTVTTQDGTIYKDIPLRYNAFNDVLEFRKNDASYDLMPKEVVQKARIGDQIFTYREYEPGGLSNKGYFSILAEGKATLFSRYKVNFYDEEPQQGYAEVKKARFDDLLETFWISIDQSPLKRISNNKRLIEILGDKKSQIQSYISKQKLSTKKANDLKSIVNYYNTL